MEAVATPFPTPDMTPPVTKTNFRAGLRFGILNKIIADGTVYDEWYEQIANQGKRAKG
ncbi:MAG: hypothetical protein AMXMBFR16_04300 [Candidatus Uhrbacteria bacterium]